MGPDQLSKPVGYLFLFVAVRFIEGSGQGVFTVSFIGYLLFFFLSLSFDPRECSLGVETLFNLAFVQTFFFPFFLLSGEHGRRRCQGNGARGGDSSTI